MKVVIAGIEGYLGWSLAVHLSDQGHEVAGFDSGLRHNLVISAGSASGIPISLASDRERALLDNFDNRVLLRQLDLATDLGYYLLHDLLAWFQPDAIVHFAEMPSAPYSMIGREQAITTHSNNLNGTINMIYAIRDACPYAHLIKLGTMGEYGTPGVPIPEGVFPSESRWVDDAGCEYDISGTNFPRKAGSWYHQTKVHGTHNVDFACRMWGLRATDIMQGVVYGTKIEAMEGDPRLNTRFDFDETFGTCINRFCAQSVIDHPLTVYGEGGQTRGYLPLRDSMRCVTLVIENPPDEGHYRVFNQLARLHSVRDIAETVLAAARRRGLEPQIQTYENPRIEEEQHEYDVATDGLREIGYEPSDDLPEDALAMIGDLIEHRDIIQQYISSIAPRTLWKHDRPRNLMRKVV